MLSKAGLRDRRAQEVIDLAGAVAAAEDGEETTTTPRLHTIIVPRRSRTMVPRTRSSRRGVRASGLVLWAVPLRDMLLVGTETVLVEEGAAGIMARAAHGLLQGLRVILLPGMRARDLDRRHGVEVEGKAS